MLGMLWIALFASLPLFASCQNDIVLPAFDAVASENCSKKLDLIFLLDNSESITQANFDTIKEWVYLYVEGLNIGEDNVQVGVVTYSSYLPSRSKKEQDKYITTEIGLGEHNNIDDFKDAMQKIEYDGYRTYTAQGINKTLNEDFVSANNRYPEARRNLILVTDGRASDHDDLKSVVERATKDFGVVMYVVGVANVSVPELLLIANNHTDRVIILQTFSQLQDILNKVRNRVKSGCDCDAGGSIGENCDSCSKQCLCKRHVVGRRCESCEKGHYGHGSEQGCLECACDQDGTDFLISNSTCDQTTGQCECKPGYTGVKCDKCEDGYQRIFAEQNLCLPLQQEPNSTQATTTSVMKTATSTTTARPTTAQTTSRPVATTTRSSRRRCWPSYCHGWLCRRRWPYDVQMPSQRRCYSGNWTCRRMVENYGYNNNENTLFQPRHYRGYYRHARAYRFQYQGPRYYQQQYYRPPVKYNLYKN